MAISAYDSARFSKKRYRSRAAILRAIREKSTVEIETAMEKLRLIKIDGVLTSSEEAEAAFSGLEQAGTRYLVQLDLDAIKLEELATACNDIINVESSRLNNAVEKMVREHV